MKISRLFEIVYLLLEKRTITAKELAAHFEVSARTILTFSLLLVFQFIFKEESTAE